MPDLSRFSIYRHAHEASKRVKESLDLMPFLLELEGFVRLDDVEYGPDSPDFVFRHADKSIGVELTISLPKVFPSGGFAQKGDFKTWKAETKTHPQPRHEFAWPEYTSREALAALESHLDTKARKVRTWKAAFPEKWLLLHVDSGSPFAELVANRRHDTPGSENKVADHIAKIAYSVHSIFQKPHPFDSVIFFSGRVILAFPAGGTNPYRLPTPRADILARGAAAPDDLLDWSHAVTSVVEHPLLE